MNEMKNIKSRNVKGKSICPRTIFSLFIYDVYRRTRFLEVNYSVEARAFFKKFKYFKTFLKGYYFPQATENSL